MDKLTHVFRNGEVPEAEPFNEISNKVNALIDGEGKVIEMSGDIEELKATILNALANMPDGSHVTLQVQQNKEDLSELWRVHGRYALKDPQSLEIDPTRKDVAISSESMSEVAAEGWAISQPIVIRKGNIYRIKVGEASGQYVTTAMRYQYRDEQGNLRYAYKRKTQLDEHSELPVDGYLIMYGLPRDYELVVCFKYTADYDPVVEVLTAGLLRTLAFQLGDMQDMIDQKLDVNGHSSAASVGGAMALLQKGDVPEDTYSELLTARMIGNAPDLMHVHGSTDTRTGIDDGKDVNVVVEKVWGDVIGGNQMAYKGIDIIDFENVTSVWDNNGGVTITNVSRTAPYTGGSMRGEFFKVTPGHKILPLIFEGRIKGLGVYVDFIEFGNIGIAKDEPYTPVLRIDKTFDFINFLPVGKSITIHPILLDLTHLFPTDPDFVTSLTRDDAIKVAHRLGFAAFTLD